jgi:hypothetical protein
VSIADETEKSGHGPFDQFVNADFAIAKPMPSRPGRVWDREPRFPILKKSIASAGESWRGGGQFATAILIQIEHYTIFQTRALSFGHFLEATQGLNLLIEGRNSVHRVKHHHLGTETTPPVGGSGPALGGGLGRAQPSLQPKGGWIPTEKPVNVHAALPVLLQPHHPGA